jgi:GNAT superfamily N-acetyltransferase
MAGTTPGAVIASHPIVRLATSADLPQVIDLLHAYYTEWDIWQRDTDATVRESLEHPPLGYLLVEVDDRPAGCVQIKALPAIPDAVECKRLFVSPDFRGHRLAGVLMDATESAARAAGYAWMYLDTRPEFAAAVALYHRRGYQTVERYNDNPQATIFMRLALV